MAVRCNLQLLTGTNVRNLSKLFGFANLLDNQLGRILRVLMFPHWAIWLAYIITILTAPNIVYPKRWEVKLRSSYSTNQNSGSIGYFACDSDALYLLAVASILSSAIPRARLEDHRNSGLGQEILGYGRLLTIFMAINAIAGSCQLCGALVIYSISLAKSTVDTNLHQGIFLVGHDHRRRAI